MKFSLIGILCFLFFQKSIWENNFFTTSNNINRLKKEASFAFWKKNYGSAKDKYLDLINFYKVKEEAININLAHCFFETGDTANARKIYENFNNSKNNQLKSVALQQLGLLAFSINNKEKSIMLTRLSLQTDPYNDGARYNYEILKKLNISENLQETDNHNGNDNQDTVRQKQDRSISESKKNNRSRIENRTTQTNGLSQEKAKMILDAIENEEADYMHKKKKSQKTKTDKNKPDW